MTADQWACALVEGSEECLASEVGLAELINALHA